MRQTAADFDTMTAAHPAIVRSTDGNCLRDVFADEFFWLPAIRSPAGDGVENAAAQEFRLQAAAFEQDAFGEHARMFVLFIVCDLRSLMQKL